MTPDGGRIDDAKFAAARLFATSTYPYLAAALFASPCVAARGSETIAVDQRWRIIADPAVVDRLEPQDLGRLLVHLISHLLRDHAGRATHAGITEPGHAAEHWNRAADAEINDDLESEGMVPPAASDLAEAFGADRGQLAEQYYEVSATGIRQWDCGSGCDSVERPWDGAGSRAGDIDERRAAWLRLGVAAEMQRLEGLAPGTVPGGWLRWAEQQYPSKVDWRRLIAAEVRSALSRRAGMVDYSYRRPSRRADAVATVVLPSLERPVPDVAVVCDTSGSMASDQLARVLVEVEAILQRAGLPDGQLQVLACDAEVHSVRRVSKASQIQLLGGGGTDMGAGILQAAALRPRPNVIVVLTDGWTPWPDSGPRSTTVIAGIIADGSGRSLPSGFRPPPPPWIRTVEINT